MYPFGDFFFGVASHAHPMSIAVQIFADDDGQTMTTWFHVDNDTGITRREIQQFVFQEISAKK